MIIVVVAAAIAGWVRDIVAQALGGLSYGRRSPPPPRSWCWCSGVIAALNQIGVATTVTLPVLIAVLATVAGVLIVGVGGGLVRPMQHRWERMLNRAETETDHRGRAGPGRNRADRMANTAGRLRPAGVRPVAGRACSRPTKPQPEPAEPRPDLSRRTRSSRAARCEVSG